MPTKSLRESFEDSLSGAYIRGYRKGQKDFAEKAKAEIEEKISHYDHFQGSNTAHGLEIALEIIDKHIEGVNK